MPYLASFSAVILLICTLIGYAGYSALGGFCAGLAIVAAVVIVLGDDKDD
jgi:hypothetical protein